MITLTDHVVHDPRAGLVGQKPDPERWFACLLAHDMDTSVSADDGCVVRHFAGRRPQGNVEPRPYKCQPRGRAECSILERREHELDQYGSRDTRENDRPEAPRSREPDRIGPVHGSGSAESERAREQPEHHCPGLRVLQLQPVSHSRPPRRRDSSMVDLIVPACQGRSSDNYYTSAPASRPCRQIASAAKPLGVVCSTIISSSARTGTRA